MKTVFLLLIFAIAALSLIAVITGLFNPFLNPSADLEKIIEKDLRQAQVTPGTATPITTIALKGTESLNATFFETQLRKMGFGCLDPAYCCSQKDGCNLSVIANNQRLIITQKTMMRTSTRCDDSKTVQSCVVFIGKSPGQIQIKAVTLPSSVVLNNNPAIVIPIAIENTGELPIEETITAKWRLFKVIMENNVPQYEFVREGDQSSIEKMLPEKGITINPTVTVLSEGDYRLEIRVASEDGGFDEKNQTFKAVGNASLCQIDYPPAENAQWLNTNQCAKKSPCTGTCVAAFECQESWQRAFPAQLFESATPAYAYEIVDDAFCQ